MCHTGEPEPELLRPRAIQAHGVADSRELVRRCLDTQYRRRRIAWGELDHDEHGDDDAEQHRHHRRHASQNVRANAATAFAGPKCWWPLRWECTSRCDLAAAPADELYV